MAPNDGKQKKKTDRNRLDELIDWYEQNKPSAGQRILCALSPEALGKMLGIQQPRHPKILRELLPWPREQSYRGRSEQFLYAIVKTWDRLCERGFVKVSKRRGA